MGTGRRLQATVAVLAVVMLFASVLAIAQRSDFLESVAQVPTRDLVNPADTITSAEAALLEQLARVGDGITLEGNEGASASIDGRFMLAGPAFETDAGAAFSVVTSSWMGAEIASAAEPVLDGDRVLYEHDGWTEWWIRSGSGYEQGWTVDAPPANGSTELTLDVVFEGAATTQLSPTTVELILGDGSRAWYRNLHAFDAEGTVLPAHLTTQGSRITINVDAEGAVYPVTIDPLVDAEQEILAPATAVGDQFGWAVSAADDLMVVGIPNADRDSGADQGPNRGRVELLGWDGSEWQPLDSVDYPGTGEGGFGWSVDIVSDSVVVVGAPFDDANGTDSGAVYIYNVTGGDTLDLDQVVYKCDPGAGTCDGTATGAFGGEAFGYDVGISANKHLVVGAPGVAGTTPGEAFVYTPNTGQYALPTGGQLAPLVPIAAGDRFGEAVDITEDDGLVIVGAPGNDEGANFDVGKAYLFNLATIDTYNFVDSELGPSFSNNLQYGAAVSIGREDNNGVNEAIVAIGAPFASRRDPITAAGAASVEVKSANAVGFGSVARGDITTGGVDDGFGFSVEVDSNLIIVGRPFDGDVALDAGAVDVYQYEPATNSMDNGGGGSSAARQPDPTNTFQDENDLLGWSVSWSRSQAQVLAGGIGYEAVQNGRTVPDLGVVLDWQPGDSSSAFTGSTTTSRPGDRFGGAVAVSGNRMAVLASGDEMNENGRTGAVLFYERATEADPWSFDMAVPAPAVDTISGDPAVVDEPYGSLDMEGNFLVVGMADDNDQMESGAVAVYSHNGTTWVLRDQFDESVGNTSVNDYGGFGTDVAISSNGDWVAVGYPGADVGCGGGTANCGSVMIMGWNGTAYVLEVETESPDFTDESRTGISVDLDQVPGSTFYRVISGRLNDTAAVDSWTFDPSDADGTLALEASISTSITHGESVALDGNRLVAAQSSTASDIAIVADFVDGQWLVQTLTDAELAPNGVAVPNQFVDVEGDYAAVGRADNAGGEVGVFFNDPTYGWGFPDSTVGGAGGPRWTTGPVDRVQPSGRNSGDGIGFSVAIGATVGGGIQLVSGAPNTPDAGADAGAVHAFDVTYTGTALPANKFTIDGSGRQDSLGRSLSVDASWAVAGAPARAPGEVTTLRSIAGAWSVDERIDGSVAGATEGFGQEVAIDGNTMVVASFSPKAIHLFTRANPFGAPFIYQDSALITELANGATVGSVVNEITSVAVSGTNIVVGIADDHLAVLAKHDGAEIANNTDGLLETGPSILEFGTDVDIDGDLVAVAARAPSSAAAATGDPDAEGLLYVYDLSSTPNAGNLYVPTDVLNAPQDDLQFPDAVAVSGARIVASQAGGFGPLYGDSLTTTDSGATYLFEGGFGSYSETFNFEPVGAVDTSALGPADAYGFDVDIAGDRVVIGARSANEFNVPWRSGVALGWAFDGITWVQTDVFRASDDAPDDGFGTAVGITDFFDGVVVGAPTDSNAQGQGAGSVYSFSASAPPALPGKIVSPEDLETFGFHVEIAGDLAVIGHDRQYWYTYRFDGSDWILDQTFDEGDGDQITAVSLDGAEGSRRVAIMMETSDVQLYVETCAPDCELNFVRTESPTGVPWGVAIGGDVVVAVTTDGLNIYDWTTGFVSLETPADFDSSDEFGSDVAVLGDLVFVGAPRWDSAGTTDAGIVYVYDSVGGAFATIEANNDGQIAGDLFGWSLAAQGDRLVVGYPGGRGPEGGGAVISGTGRVEVFTGLTAAGGTFEQSLTAADIDVADFLGSSVDIDGNIIVAGSSAKTHPVVGRAGRVYAYALAGGVWTETDQLDALDKADGDQLGFDVAIGGVNVLGGAPFDDRVNSVDAGAVYPFTVDPAEPANKVLPNAGADGTLLGEDLVIQGDAAVATAAGTSPAVVRLDQNPDGSWSITQSLTFAAIVRDVAWQDDGKLAVLLADGDVIFYQETCSPDCAFVSTGVSGSNDGGDPSSVEIVGDQVIIATPNPTGSNYISQVSWVDGSNSTVTPPTGIDSTDEFGAGMSVGAGGIVFIGAPLYEDPAGGVDTGRVFAYNPANQTIDFDFELADAPLGTVNNAQLGRSIAVDGSRLVVGASSLGLDGAIFVYDHRAGDTFVTLEDQLDPAGGSGLSGWGFSVDVEGNTIVAGATAYQESGVPFRDGTAVSFIFDGTDWIETDRFDTEDGEGADQVGHAVGISGGDVLVGARQDDNTVGTDAGAVYWFTASPAPAVDDPALTFSLDLGPGSPASVPVAPTGIAVSEFNRSIVEGASDNESSIAAASLGETDLEASPLSALPIADTPLSALAADDQSIVSTIPLIEITIDGGWESVLDGTELSETPLVDLTLGDVADDATALGRLESTPLSALDVDGTPLSALPLSALALGSLPLSALPQPDGTTWCDILVPDYVNGTCAEAESLTLFEATLTGVPLSALPLSALPLSALPLSALPLSALPLSALDLDSTPLSALPLSALPLSALDVNGTPLSALPLSALPLSALDVNGTPLSALPLSALELNGTPLSALPLSALPLSALEVRNVPLSALQVEGAPLSALPLSALPLSALVLADTPLSALPLSALDTDYTDWCDLLSDLDAGYDCTNGVDDATFLAQTTIADLGVRGVPLSALPLSALPLSALGLTDTPLSALPLSALPLSALPLSALPLSALTVNGTPLSALPLSALDVQGSPLSALPLSALPLSALPLSALPLSALPLSALPLSALPLSALDVNGTPLSALPLSALDIDSTPLSALPLSALPLSALNQVDCSLADCGIDSLNDAIVSGALDPASLTLADVQDALGGIRLGEISDSITTATEQDVIDAVANAVNGVTNAPLTMEDLSDLDDLRLGELPAGNVDLGAVTLADIEAALWSVRLSDLVGTILDPATGQPLANVEADLLADVAGFTFGDWEYLGTATLGELLQGGDGGEFFSELGPILGLIHVRDLTGITAVDELLGDADLGDLTLLDLFGQGIVDPNSGENIDDLLLGDLLTGADDNDLLEGFTITDLLLALLGIDPVQFSGLDFTEIESGQLPEDAVPPASFAATFEVTGTQLDKSVEVEILIPATATYIPGTGTIDSGAGPEPLEPAIGENVLIWTLTDVGPDTETTIGFDVRPTVTIGATSLSGSALIVGSDIDAEGTAVVAVTEGSEPNDFPDVVTAAEDTVYLTYISSETDNDVFAIDLAEGDELAVQLSSLSSDLDFAVYARPTDPGAAAALSGASPEAPITPITNPDQTEAEAEPVNDFRRLDLEDTTLDLLGVSNAAGTENELFVTEALPAGRYFIQVYGANGATNVEPAALQIQVLEAEVRPDCANVGAGTVTGAIGTDQLGPAGANTVFLVNQQRMDHYYGQAGLDTVTAVKDFATWLNGPNGPAGVTASVVSVDSYGVVDAAFDAWDADGGCSPETANGVVAAINGVVDGFRADLEHLVVVGGDPIIPMARLLDETSIANEYDFRYEFVGDNVVGADPNQINALSATFWDRTYLSDEPYGETAARDLGNRFLYVSDIALGRLVETPTEIQGMLSHFQNFDGQLDAQTAAVLGYDFLVDSSEQIAADLADPALGITVDDELADGTDAGGALWDRDDAADKVVPAAGDAPDLISLNGHFDHYRALPANGDKVPGFNENFLADTVLNEISATPSILQGSIIFSMGCHGGLNVSDLQVGDAGDNTNGDWAQTFASDQAIFLGNTGFGYGDTEAVAYTEALLARFAELAVRPTDLGGGQQTTVGQALTFAKNDYAADLSVFSVYDEKALMEMTFYGLPFYTIDLGTVDAPPAPDNTTAPDATGIQTLGVNADASNDVTIEDRGTFWSNPDESGDPQTIVSPGRPIQPSLTTDVSVVDPNDSTALDQVAHGALILGMDSTYQSPVDPVVAAVVFNESEASPEPEVGDVVFPAKPVTINTSTTPGGQRQSLVLATGQFDSNGSTQRLDDNINAVVYYSGPAETDFDAPTIGVVESNFDPVADLLTITLTADDIENDVVRVYVLAAPDPGAGSVTWTGLDLVQTAGTDEWSGSLSLPGDEVEFLIQAVDSAGNVGFATNKARNFVDDGTEDPAPPTPDLTVTVPAPGPLGWYTGPVTVTVDSGDLDATYEISPGGVSTPITGGEFEIDGQGSLEWTVITSNGQEATGTVRIDSTAPVALLAPPADGTTYEVSAVPAVGYSCADPSLVSCVASVTGPGGSVALAPGDALPTDLGAYTVTVTATDVFSNQATASASYTVVADPLDPLDVTVSPANLDVGTGLYTGDVEITVVSETDVEYTLNGGTPATIAAPGGTFTISDDGETAWAVTRPADGANDSGSVEIDTTAPVVTITAPIDAEIYTPGNVPAIDFDCADANLAAVDPCVATIDGAPIADGDPLPDAVGGPYVVEVTGTDALGLQTIETASYTVTELTVTVSPDNLDLLSGLYTGPVEVTVDGGGFATEYTLNGGTPVAIPAAGGTFTITAEEVTEWTVTRAADGAEATGTVEIDTTAPTASLIAPADGADFSPGTVPAIDFDCTDRNLSSCEATVDGAPVALGAPLPDAVGSYDIVVTGTDAVGLTAIAAGTYTVTAPPGDPIIVTDIEIDGVAEPGEAVDIWGSFIGGIAPYSISVDWGDGGSCADGTCNIEAPTVTEDGMFDAGYVYPVGGVYTVTVTITDAAGASVAETLTSATCTITGTNGKDVLRGTAGDDVICGFGGDDRLFGRGGNDIIFGGSGRDRLYGQSGNDLLFGGRDNDILYGSFGDDEMSGGRGVDTLIGGDGDDILKGRQDNDWMYGQNHNDTLIGNRGNDRMFGGSGDDIMDGRRGNDWMYGQGGADTMDGGNGVDRMYGGSGNDAMDGGNNADRMYGGNGNDIMNGQNGDDDIYGGRGNDTIDGGAATDLCRGGNGTDTLLGCEL